MSNKRLYFHVYPSTVDGCELTLDADETARRTWLCAGCNAPKPGIQAIDVSIRAAPGAGSLNAVVGWGVPIALGKCIETFADDLVHRDLFIGRVLDSERRELSDWVTYRGRCKVIIRGSKNISHRHCAECGRNVYFATGKRYLHPHPPDDCRLFESDLCGLVMCEELFAQSSVKGWTGVTIDKLQVLETPRDALGQLPYAART